MELLNTETAVKYVKDYFAGLEYDSEDDRPALTVLGSVELTEADGFRFVDVDFNLSGYKRDHTFSVWIENGKLYGEW